MILVKIKILKLKVNIILKIIYYHQVLKIYGINFDQTLIIILYLCFAFN